MNAERAVCFGKEESYWNDLLIEEMNSLAETDRLLMDQQVKTVDRTSRYHHYYRCKWPRR